VLDAGSNRRLRALRVGQFAQSGRLDPLKKGRKAVRYGIVGLLIVIAIVLVLVKVAVAGGILGLIALILLILLLLGRL
jgi:flagellin-like protein